MSNIGILTVKDFNRIRRIIDKGKNNITANSSNNETTRLNSKSQLSGVYKEKKEFGNTTNKILSSTDSTHSPSHIPSLSKKSKSSLSANKEKSLLGTENKSNKKKPRILQPTLIHDRNKNNKISKIPFRKIQTFEESKDETKESLKSDTNSVVEKEDDFTELNSEKDDLEFKETVSEFQTQQKVLNQIEELNTIPFNKDNNAFISDDYENDKKTSDYRNNILSLQMKIDSLRERRKKELAILHEQAIKQKQIYNETSRNLINGDDESIIELQNELMKHDADSMI